MILFKSLLSYISLLLNTELGFSAWLLKKERNWRKKYACWNIRFFFCDHYLWGCDIAYDRIWLLDSCFAWLLCVVFYDRNGSKANYFYLILACTFQQSLLLGVWMYCLKKKFQERRPSTTQWDRGDNCKKQKLTGWDKDILIRKKKGKQND